jgi:hypothetical protein
VHELNRNKPRDERLDSLEIYFNREMIPRDYLSRQTERMLVYPYDCASQKPLEAEPAALSGTDGF